MESEGVGCRETAISAVLLIAMSLAFMAVGLSLVNGDSCDGACETLGLTLLYAGLPMSAIFGVLFGDLVVAWPLDITFWVVMAFVLANVSERRGSRPLPASLIAVAIALIYGLVLSQFVEIAI